MLTQNQQFSLQVILWNINQMHTTQSSSFLCVSHDGVKPGLVISVVGLARYSLDFRLVRDL